MTTLILYFLAGEADWQQSFQSMDVGQGCFKLYQAALFFRLCSIARRQRPLQALEITAQLKLCQYLAAQRPQSLGLLSGQRSRDLIDYAQGPQGLTICHQTRPRIKPYLWIRNH